ncbi:hypothetical protein BDF22DRAFT_692618 [Syncephalis plumigaleata]|nr:hypothetical protein BDF22DRAFT_692618 [Syncephalis plumigaleata]
MTLSKGDSKQTTKPVATTAGWSKLSIILVAALVPLTAFLCYDVLRLYKITGITRSVPFTQQNCKHITQEKLEGCEDLAIHHRSGQAFLACGSVATRRAHMSVGTYATNATDSLFSYDLKTGNLKEITIEGLGDDGIGIWDPYDTIIIMAINNRRNESVVEIMEYQLGTSKAKIVETARHPLISTPNGVLPTSARSFYISNDLWGRKNFIRTFEMVTAREWSSVVYRNEHGDAMVVADHLGFPNASPDGKLILRDRIDVPILSDNLRVNPVDGSFLVSAMRDPNYAAHGAVVRIANNTDADLYFGVKYKQEIVFSESTKEITPLSPEYKKLLLGSIVGSGFHVCDAELL